jgi:putative peptidoglycan lipid II flippase
MKVPGESDLDTRWLLASQGRVLASAAMLGAATVLAKLIALGKDWMVARRFGAGDEVDAFLIAFVIPSFGVAVLGHSFAQAFVPTYLGLRERGSPAAARRLVDGVLVAGFVLLVAIALLLAIVAPYLLQLIGSGFDPAKLELALRLFYVLLAVLVAGGISSILAAVLNAHEQFAATALAALCLPLGMVVGFGLFQERFGIFALAGGTLAGSLLECLLLAGALGRSGLIEVPRLRGLDEATLYVGSRYWPVAAGSLLMSSSAVVDQSMAASLGSGNVSILNYGNKIVALVLSVVAVSLSTVLFPRFSRQIAAGQWGELKRTIDGYAKAILIGSLPVVALLALLAGPMIGLLFERGAFTPQTTAAAARVQTYLALQIPFYILAMVGARVLSALDSNQIVLRIAALNLVLNVAGDYLLMQWFGVDGIAMATSLVYLAAAIVTWSAIRAKIAERRHTTDSAESDA